METCDFFHQWTQTHPNPAQGGGGGGAPGEKKTFLGAQACGPSARPRLGWPSGPRKGLRSGPPPPLFLVRDPSTPPRAPQTQPPGRGPGSGGEAWSGWGRQRCGRWGSRGCLLDARWAPVAHRRLRAGAEARSWRSRRLEGAVLTVARGRLNPLLPLQGLGKEGEEGWP